MIGRDAERRRIGRFLAEGARRHAVCVVSGDAGLGKTTLLAAAVEAARRRGTTTLHAAPADGERDLPFSTLGDLLDAEAPSDPPALLRLVRDAAAQAPLLIALDDLEAVDDSSWRALLFVLRRLGRDRVAVLVAVRAPDSSARAAAVVRTAGTSRVHRIRLEPLGDAEIEQLLRAEGLLPAQRAARDWLVGTAGGNPYAALELAAAIGEDDAKHLPGVIPRALSSVLRRSLEDVPAAPTRALLAVALAGRTRRDVAERALGRGAAAALDDAVRLGLLVDRGEAGLRPAHPLLAAAAIDASSTRARRGLHLRLSAEATDPVERALHLARATATADAAVAAAVEAAAGVALGRGAPAEAAGLHAHAARLTPADRPQERTSRLLASADALASAGASRRAIAVLEDLVRTLGPGAQRASVLARLGALRYRVDRVDTAVATFRNALDEAGSTRGLRTDLLHRLALAELMSGDLAAAADGSAAAGTGRFRAMVSTVGGMPGAAEDAAAPLEEQPRPDLPVELRPATIRALAWTVLHGSARGARELDLLWRQAEREGDSASLPYLLANLCEAQLACGAWKEADALAVRARMLIDDEPDALTAFLLAALSRLATCRGRLTEARSLGLRGLSLARQTGMVPAIHYNESALGFLELTRGRYDAVEARLGGIVAGLASLGLGEPMFARFVPDLIESRIRLGYLDAAGPALAWWEERGRTLDRPFARATAARCRALLLGSANDRHAADVALAEAREHHGALDEPFELARTELVAGLVHRRARRWGKAHAAFSSALEAFGSLGAPLWTAAAETELARLGTGSRPTDSGGLTASERRLVELVAAGRTNREAALELFVAESTVEASLWRIYRKLGVRSRTELTRWALAPRPRAGRAAARPPRA